VTGRKGRKGRKGRLFGGSGRGGWGRLRAELRADIRAELRADIRADIRLRADCWRGKQEKERDGNPNDRQPTCVQRVGHGGMFLNKKTMVREDEPGSRTGFRGKWRFPIGFRIGVYSSAGKIFRMNRTAGFDLPLQDANSLTNLSRLSFSGTRILSPF